MKDIERRALQELRELCRKYSLTIVGLEEIAFRFYSSAVVEPYTEYRTCAFDENSKTVRAQICKDVEMDLDV